uniref:Transmembrane protein 44 n=1 Tax=Athene cunicularia TaxID=194338 RepID=A0A663N085_ATHCN
MLGAAPAGQCWQPVVALPAQRRSEPAMQGTLPVGHSGSAAWPASCLAGELVCVSWGLWTLAAVGLLCSDIPGSASLCCRVSLQILTGAYMAVTDLICFLLTLFPLCLPESQRLAGVCRGTPPCHGCRLVAACSELRALGALCPCWAAWHGHLGNSSTWGSGMVPWVFLCLPSLGFVLGLLSALLALIVRTPTLSRACRGKPCTRRWLWATLCSATAGVLYAAAIVARDQQPGHILRALPWLLIALGSAALDMAVSFLSFSPGILGWDMEVDADVSHSPLQAAKWAPLNMFPKPRSAPRMVAASHCLDLMIRLVQQVRVPGLSAPPGGGAGSMGSGMLLHLWQRMSSLQMDLGCMPRFGGVDASALLSCTAGRGQQLADAVAM